MEKKGFGIGNLAIIDMAKRGYTADEFGNMYNTRGNIVSGYRYDMGGIEYRRVSVRFNGKIYGILKHRFIAYIKFGMKVFEEGIVVRHLDGDSLNNTFKNLEIGTMRDNIMDIPANLRSLYASSPKHDHKQIIKDSETMTRKQVMEKHGISSTGTYHFITNNSLEKKGLKSA